MTVAHIRDRKGADYVEVLFLESARFYKLPKDTPTHAETLRLLREALAQGRVLNILLATPDGDVIEGAQSA